MRLNLLTRRRIVEYRTYKRRQAVLLLRRIGGGRLAPYDWRARLMEHFEATLRKEAETE